METLGIIIKWYGYLLLFLSLCAWIFASYITRNIGFGLKWAFHFAGDITFQLLSRLVFNFPAAMLVNKQWDLRVEFAKLIWQTPDSKTNGGGINGDRTPCPEKGGTGGDQGFYDKWRVISDWSEKYLGTFGQYLIRVLITWLWLQRNCNHGFSCYVMGMNRERAVHIEKVESGNSMTVMAYMAGWKLIGFEYKNKGFFFGKGDCRIGCKITAWQTWYPAQFVYRLRPLRKV